MEKSKLARTAIEGYDRTVDKKQYASQIDGNVREDLINQAEGKT